MKISFLGPPGTFCHQAALKWSGESGLAVPAATIARVVAAVQEGSCRFGVIPLENSLEGSVADSLRALSEMEAVFITGEILLPVTHCLLARENVELSQLDKIYSHPHALGQCRKFLSSLPAAQLVAVASTAAAARLVASGSGMEAAVAPIQAARIYNLRLLRSHIEDREDSVTRFIVLGKEPVPATGNDKCSLMVALKHQPGSLYRLLGVFARREINMLRIESRPARKSLGEYIFFIDLEGHIEDARLPLALKEAASLAAFFKHLGSYPAAGAE